MAKLNFQPLLRFRNHSKMVTVTFDHLNIFLLNENNLFPKKYINQLNSTDPIILNDNEHNMII